MEQTVDKQVNTSKWSAIWQFVKFGLVGVMNTFVSYAVYSICYYVLKTNVHVANVMGFIISVLNAFIWQSKFVFKQTEEAAPRVWWKVLIKTYISYSFSGLFLTEILLLFWLDVINLGQYLGGIAAWLGSFGVTMSGYDLAVSAAPFLNMVITVPINFLVNKFWAYRQK